MSVRTCTWCGTIKPLDEGTVVDNRYYCQDACLQAHEAKPNSEDCGGECHADCDPAPACENPKRGTMHNAALVAMILLDNDQRLEVLRRFCPQCGEERDRCECEVGETP
jgi:hypothetical protein